MARSCCSRARPRTAHVTSSGSWRSDRPIVLLDEPVDHPGALVVRAAEREGVRRLAAHLLERGRERIAFVGAAKPSAGGEQRLLGYRDALVEAGLKPRRHLQHVASADVHAAVERLLRLREPPTAIIAATDLVAFAVMQRLRANKVEIPTDIAVTGFGDLAGAALSEPSLTSVHVPSYEMGLAAATMLIDELDGRSPIVRQAVFGVELRLRDST
jgi:DNA-binding LacI/PurR family transcriptional regulator